MPGAAVPVDTYKTAECRLHNAAPHPAGPGNAVFLFPPYCRTFVQQNAPEPVQDRFGGIPFLVGDEGQQRDLTGALDGLGQLTLMHGAGAGGAAGQDLAPLRQEPAQLGRVRIGIVCA